MHPSLCSTCTASLTNTGVRPQLVQYLYCKLDKHWGENKTTVGGNCIPTSGRATPLHVLEKWQNGSLDSQVPPSFSSLAVQNHTVSNRKLGGGPGNEASKMVHSESIQLPIN